MLQFTKRISSTKSDFFGIFASFLCLIHCLGAPILLSAGYFFTGRSITHWHGLDIIFILLGILAVVISTRDTSVPAIKLGFWVVITLFSSSILFHELWQGMVYISSLSSILLIILHFLHWKYHR